ncbi:alpha/beta hydrolase-fold protein [Oceanobacter kriegii]|uniref:alpha/beta hydrolase-fold protein n=1 Tax=Oceanobacter kriegii TaxID=64972 RepID=UPI00146F7366|nr:alpha/beta hydrolase-fold protein [Oceanobacter kriegii]
MKKRLCHTIWQQLLTTLAIFLSQSGQAQEWLLQTEQPLEAQQVLTQELSLPANHIVTGLLTGPEGTRLSLTSKGEHLRWLLTGEYPSADFIFTVPATGRYQLNIISPVAGKATLSIRQPVAINYFQPAGKVISELPPATDTTFSDISPSDIILSDKVKQALSHYLQHRDEQAAWQQLTANGVPSVEAIDSNTDRVTFLYRGARHNVKLMRGPSGTHEFLDQLANSAIWFKSFDVPSDTLLSYQLAPDTPTRLKHLPGPNVLLASARQDPMNPMQRTTSQYADVFNTESVLALRDAALSPWLNAPLTPPHVEHHRFTSQRLNNERRVSIAWPSLAEGQRPTAVAIFFDGRAHQSTIPAANIVQNLIDAGEIPATLCVFINNPSRQARNTELPANDHFADMLAFELMPWLRQTTGLEFDAENTLLAGASYGGLAAVFSSWKHPDVFGLALSQSGSFWWPANGKEPEWLTRQLANSATGTSRFYLNAGRFETGFASIDILESNRHLRTVLQAKGYDVVYEEFSGNHDSLQWRNNLANGLMALLGTRTNEI